jgi:hypothetical protein
MIEGSLTPAIIVMSVAVIGVTIVGLRYLYRLSQTVRSAARRLQADILAQGPEPRQGEPLLCLWEDVSRSPQATAVGIQDLVVRYVLLWLALEFWYLVIRLLQFVVSVATRALIGGGLGSDAVRLSSTVNLASLFGGSAILLAFGWPLLSDIACAVGRLPPASMGETGYREDVALEEADET